MVRVQCVRKNIFECVSCVRFIRGMIKELKIKLDRATDYYTENKEAEEGYYDVY